MRTRPSWNHPYDEAQETFGDDFKRRWSLHRTSAPREKLVQCSRHARDGCRSIPPTSIVLKARLRVDRNCMFPAPASNTTVQ
jgi:hypothetical protein